MDEEDHLRAIENAPADWARRMAYAEWLEQRGDRRAELLRAEDALRTLPIGSPERRGEGRRWRKLRASLERDWLARVRSDAVVPPWLRPSATEPARLGVREFDEWMCNNHREWVILAVLAPLEIVARALIESRCLSRPEWFLKEGLWQQNLPVRSGRIGEAVSPLTPIVQMRGHAWTVAVYDTFRLTMASYCSAQEDARELSQSLGTVALEFSEEDTSGATGYHLFQCGEMVEFAEWSAGDGRIASKEQRRPPWRQFPPDYPDPLFRELGLYIPPCYAVTNDSGPSGLALDGPSAEEMERADLLALGAWFQTPHWGALQAWQTPFPEVHTFENDCTRFEFPSPAWPYDEEMGTDEIPF